MRVGDALLALGELQRAAQVYMALARHAAHAGHPLRSIVAIKVLATLEPKLGQLLDDVAALYGRQSTRLGRGVRTSAPDPDQPIDAAIVERWTQNFDVLDAVTQTATVYRQDDWVMPEKLMPIPLLSLLDREEFAAALHAVNLVRTRPGQPVITQGEPGKSFFVLSRGSVVVSAGEGDSAKELALLSEGAIFGEMALLSNAPRSAHVVSVSDCDLLEFDRDALAAASATARRLGEALSAFARDRLLNNVMRTSGIFQPLDPKQRRSLVKHFTAVEVKEGQEIIKQGEPGNGLHVVLRGSVVVSREADGKTRELAKLGVGEMFGEIAILNDSPTTASIRAAEPILVLFLGRTYVERLMEGVPEIREHIEQIGEQRMIETFRSARTDPPPPGDDDIEIFI
jgi:cAMP-dependent protein kinase regulator